MSGRNPQGAAALHPHWPEARFNVAGVFQQQPLIFKLFDVLDKGFACRAPIEILHGAPAVSWNAGRISDARLDRGQFESTLNTLNAVGVGYCPTFTNRLVEFADLADPACNAILDCIDRRPELNGVIVASETLSKYIADAHPRLRQTASVIKTTLEHGVGRVDYYRQLGERFHRYVVHPDDCRNLKLLDQLDREKAEIIANENCVSDCDRRERHYEAYAMMQRASGPPQISAARKRVDDVVAGCRSSRNLGSIYDKQRNCNLTPDEMKAIYDLGFRHFKLQGRADDPFSYGYDLVRYMLEPGFVAPRVYKWLCVWLPTVVVFPQ